MPDSTTCPYPIDLSDAEWEALQPLLPPPTRLGRPLKWPRWLMAEAIFYLVRSGCAWRMLPRHFPPWQTVHSQLMRWQRDGTLRRMHDRLRELAREADGREREPSAAVIVSQTAQASGAGGPARGFDADKKVYGRKRHILVDVAGLILLVHVHAANPKAAGSTGMTTRRTVSCEGMPVSRLRKDRNQPALLRP